jgi:hypothetical protein
MGLAAGRAWTNYNVTNRSDGSASVRIQTNTTALLEESIARRSEATLEFDSLESALALTGTSRISATGVIVTVRVDGEECVG